MAEMSPKSIVGMVIGLVILIALVPQVITDWSAVNTSTWSTGVSTMWDVMPVIIIAGLVVAYAQFKK